GFALPKVELNPKGAELALQSRFRDLHEMAPQRAIAGPAGLKIDGGAPRRFQPLGIGLAGGSGARIKRLKVVHADGRLLRVRTNMVGVEIDRCDRIQLDLA